MSTHKAMQAPAVGAPFTLAMVPTPAPGADEVTIAVAAVALNPVDSKRHQGLQPLKWPVTLGLEAAGTITAVGSSVKHLSVGDKVVALSAANPHGGTFQEVVTIAAQSVAKAPKSLDLATAVSLPVAFGTAAAAVYSYPAGLGLPLGFLDGEDTTVHRDIKSILILGGSSGVGASAIQLLRNSPAFGAAGTIVTTSSAHHHDRLKELGATAAFDQRSPSLLEDVKKASPGGKGFDAIFDAVSHLVDSQEILGALREDGPKVVAVLITGPPTNLPNTVDWTDTGLVDIYKMPGGVSLFDGMTKEVDSGKFKVPFTVDIIGDKIEDLREGIETMRKGVSGKKLVIKY